MRHVALLIERSLFSHLHSSVVFFFVVVVVALAAFNVIIIGRSDCVWCARRTNSRVCYDPIYNYYANDIINSI